jgi:cobalt-zinc-cadmium resistance protein CzcA
MVENNVRRLAENDSRQSTLDIVRQASIQVARPTVFAQTINMIVYLPILALEGIEGKLFRPMSLTIILINFLRCSCNVSNVRLGFCM